MNLDFLVQRAAIVRRIRQFFDADGFLEVETPVRIAAPAPECHIDCPPVTTGGFLRASPELQMKKLLAAGLDRIYQIGPCFRDGEKGSRHNPEFTMIEWYRKNATSRDIRDDTVALMRTLTATDWQPKEIRVRDAYRDFAGWDPWTDWDADRFDYEMATIIEPQLKAIGGGIFLMDYPVQAASLAKIMSDGSESSSGSSRCPQRVTTPPVPRTPPNALSTKHQAPSTLPHADRWEFYWDGLELANCFTELCDADEQRRRFVAAKAERQALGEADYPLDEDFFACLPQIGSAAGVALGIDRLVMVLLGAPDISSVRAAE